MSIVLDEYAWAEKAIKDRTLGAKPFETFSRVARYYLDNGYSKKDVRDIMDTFLIQCEPSASKTKWSDTIDYAVERALKYKGIKIDGIPITEKEIETIDSLEGVQLRRLAFTLLCLAKYWNIINPLSNGWVNNKDSEIMKLANINTSMKRQSLMYHTLNEKELIQFSKKVDNTNVRVLFKEDNGKEVMLIRDFRNLGYQYLKYKGSGYFECESCGITVKESNPGKGRKQKYCKECAAAIKLKQNVESVMRHNKSCKLPT